MLEGISPDFWEATHPARPIESEESWAAAMKRKFPDWPTEAEKLASGTRQVP